MTTDRRALASRSPCSAAAAHAIIDGRGTDAQRLPEGSRVTVRRAPVKFKLARVAGRKLEVIQWRIGGPRDDDLDHVAPGDIKVMHRALGAYLSARDQTQQAIRMVETEDITDEHGIPFLIVYGISGNTHRFWSIANARSKIGYVPEDDSQVNFADQIAKIARVAKK